MRFGIFQQIVQQISEQGLPKTVSSAVNISVTKSVEGAERVLDALPHRGRIRSVRDAFSVALDLAKPYWQGLGLRIVKLGPAGIEVIVPAKLNNADAHQEIEEGVLCSASLFALRSLWQRMAPREGTNLWVQKIEFERLHDFTQRTPSTNGDLRIKTELLPTNRELLYAELLKSSKAQMQWSLLVTNENEKLVARVSVETIITMLDAFTALKEKNPLETH